MSERVWRGLCTAHSPLFGRYRFFYVRNMKKQLFSPSLTIIIYTSFFKDEEIK